MLKYFESFQKILYYIILLFLALVLIFSIFNLCSLVVSLLVDDGQFILESNELAQIFGYFLLVLIGIEFFDSIMTYLKDNVMHVEVIVMVAIIAVARKIILLSSDVDEPHILGLSALILGLGIAYYLIRRSNREKDWEEIKLEGKI
jgi:uncharacterized membrane protein (DUF373 family)